jgi:hypothetical protein
VTANQQLAGQLRRQAGHDNIARRRALLVAAVALAETKTITAARKVLDGWDGPATIKTEAIELLDALTQDHPAGQACGAAQEVTPQ